MIIVVSNSNSSLNEIFICIGVMKHLQFQYKLHFDVSAYIWRNAFKTIMNPHDFRYITISNYQLKVAVQSKVLFHYRVSQNIFFTVAYL